MMKKVNDNQIYRLVIGVLAVIAVILVSSMGSQLGGTKLQDDLLAQKDAEYVSVETIKQSNQANNVVVPEIKPSPQMNIEDTKEEQVVIEVPMPLEPEKPELEAPDTKPETNDNLNDPTKVPTYNDKVVVKEGEKVIVPEENKINELVKDSEEAKPSESKLVPPSENPFANPANVGKPIEVKSEDISDHVPGTGDKF